MPDRLIVVAKHAYQKAEKNILQFLRGDQFEVVEQTNKKWWAARSLKSDEFGYIPAVYFEEAHPALLEEVQASSVLSSGQSVRDRLRVFEEVSVPSFSPQLPARNDWKRSTLPAKSSGSFQPSSPTKSPPTKTVTLGREKRIMTSTAGELSVPELTYRAPSPEPIGQINRELKLENKRGGMPLGRSELQKMFDQRRPDADGNVGAISPGRHRRPPGEPDAGTELGQRLLRQSQKIKSADEEKEAEANKPEFMRVSLKKAAS